MIRERAIRLAEERNHLDLRPQPPQEVHRDEAARAVRYDAETTIAVIDLDGLKRINDTLGHPEGDRAIRDAAEVIRASFRDSDVVARLGGDEFAVLVRNDPTYGGDAATAVEVAAARLREAVARHNATAERPYELSLSLGFSGYDPAAPQPIESLLDAADPVPTA